MSKIKKLHLLLLVSAAMNIGNVHASAAAAAAAGDEDGIRTNSCASSSSSSSSSAAGGGPIPDLQMKDAVKEHFSPSGIADIVEGYSTSTYVMKYGEQSHLESLQKSLSDPAFNQFQINSELHSAAMNDYQAVVELLLNRPAWQLRPDQQGIDNAQDSAYRRGHQGIVKLLENYHPEGAAVISAYVMKYGEESYLQNLQIGLNRYGVGNYDLFMAAKLGYQSVVEVLLNLLVGQLGINQEGINQEGINDAIDIATEQGHQEIVKLLNTYSALNRPAGQLGPDQYWLNNAIHWAAIKGYQGIVAMLLNRPAGQLGPDQEVINRAIDIATEKRHQGIVKLLKAYHPEGAAGAAGAAAAAAIQAPSVSAPASLH